MGENCEKMPKLCSQNLCALPVAPRAPDLNFWATANIDTDSDRSGYWDQLLPMFEEAKSTPSQLKTAKKPKKSKIEWISERTRSKCTNIWPFWKSCYGFPVWATLKVDINSEHSVHKVFLIFYGSTILLYSERTLNGWEQGPFMPKDFVKGGSSTDCKKNVPMGNNPKI